jgi:hypothetical protein
MYSIFIILSSERNCNPNGRLEEGTLLKLKYFGDIAKKKKKKKRRRRRRRVVWRGINILNPIF